MRYFLAITREAMVHHAFLDKPIKVDLSRDEVFKLYSLLKSVTIFRDSKDAIKHSQESYYANEYTPAKHPKPIFLSFPGGYSKSEMPTNILYEVEGPEESELQNNLVTVSVPKDMHNYPTPNIEVKAYQLPDKNNLDLVGVLVGGVVIHYTEKFAELENKPLTTDLVDTGKVSLKK